MPLLTWNNDLSVNIKEIDSQHKKLVDLINELHDEMMAYKGKDVLGKVLSELLSYTKTHFFTEEEMMNSNGYPAYLTQKQEHDKLTKKVAELKNEFDAGKIVLGTEVMKFLKDWLTNHIMKSDKAYTPFLNSKGIF